MLVKSKNLGTNNHFQLIVNSQLFIKQAEMLDPFLNLAEGQHYKRSITQIQFQTIITHLKIGIRIKMMPTAAAIAKTMKMKASQINTMTLMMETNLIRKTMMHFFSKMDTKHKNVKQLISKRLFRAYKLKKFHVENITIV